MEKQSPTIILLGEQLEHIKQYFFKIEPRLINLECHLITRGLYDYYIKYRKDFVGIKELADRHSRGLKEGIIELAPNIFLILVSTMDGQSYVIGFAENVEALNPYLLNVAQGKVYTANYEGQLIPHEIKEPSETLFLNDNLLEEFQQDVTFFLTSEEFYNSRKLPYKRSSLFYGAPGNGKTSLITWAATKFDKVFVISPSDASPDIAKNINLLCLPEESKLIILEDLDSLDEQNSELLNFVDGSVFMNKAYFIGTTNYPEKLHENILSRPSRFDLFLEISRPDAISRDKLLRHHLPGLSEEDYVLHTKSTKGLNASYFQEIATLKHRAEITNRPLTIAQIIDKCKHRVKLSKTKAFVDKTNDGGTSVGFRSDED